MKLRYILLAAAIVFIGWNKYQYNQSFDRCKQLLEEIHRNQKTLQKEISLLREDIYGEVEYVK